MTLNHLHTFICALHQLHVTTLSFDWFTVLSVPFVIGYSNTLLLVLRLSIENRFKFKVNW